MPALPPDLPCLQAAEVQEQVQENTAQATAAADRAGAAEEQAQQFEAQGKFADAAAAALQADRLVQPLACLQAAVQWQKILHISYRGTL